MTKSKLTVVVRVVLSLSFVLASVIAGCGRSDLDTFSGTPITTHPATACKTTADCAATPATPHCEQSMCVACSTQPDSCPTGQKCDPASHTCGGGTGCASDKDCSSPTAHCRVDTHVCVECTSAAQCPSGDACVNDKCVGFCGPGGSCPKGQSCCGPLCVDEATDPANCGACGKGCGPYPHASAACGGAACAIGQCDPGFANCDKQLQNGCEIDTASDPANCGACGKACATGQSCSGGVCVGMCGAGGACPSGEACCGATCASTATDPNHCGSCTNACAPVPQGSVTCVGSKCAIGSCALGFADCNKVELDGCEANLATSATNCGGCGNACPGGQTCSGGVCFAGCGGGATCGAGLTCCGQTCDNLTTDLKNCGACGQACPPVSNGTPSCAGSACHIGSCNAGFADCNMKVADGCEVDIANDAANCGACGKACAAGSACVAGVCKTGGGCNGGPTCAGTAQCCGTGCADTSSDPKNCGGCGTACPPGDSCIAGTCKPALGCNGGPSCAGSQQCCATGCSDTTSDPANCGGCGVSCPMGSTCAASVCKPATTCNGGPPCFPGQKCCGNGCSDTTKDANNCGGCGKVCAPGDTCVASTCKSTMTCFGGPPCFGGEKCCPGGCTNTNDDTDNCGGCGIACKPGDVCLSGTCTPTMTCNGGPPCGGVQKCCPNGCFDTTNDPKNCGGCGVACPAGNTCVASMCQPMGCNGGAACTGTQTCCTTGCTDTATDPNNCATCGKACMAGETCAGGMCQPAMPCNGGPSCGPGTTCCASGCTDTTTDAANCGMCGTACPATASCIGSACVASEGAFNPIVNPTYLSPGVHNFTTINIPAGVTVYVAGPGPSSGTLDLHATGAIVIDGTIDLSGGPGTQNTITSKSTNQGRAGSGGYTGEPYQSAVMSAACQFIAGNPGLLGFGTQGGSGSCQVLSTTTCVSQMDPAALLFVSPPATFGGGGGVFTGYRAYGSGGGGIAGGAPGLLGAAYPGEQDCSGVSGGGGATKGQGGLAGGAPYDGKAGKSGETQCPGSMPGVPPAYVGGGGGGSIGTLAVKDLGVFTTFRTGSSGGGGSADYLNRPVFGGTSGGGGGGGALRLSSLVSITINGQVLANGGAGGDAFIGNGANANCDPQPGAAGGGGSGGLIYIAAPTVTVGNAATISATGGPGGAESLFATGGGGGDGGLGRVRLSVDPASCMLAGSFNPPLTAGCMPTAGTPGFAYIGTYPN